MFNNTSKGEEKMVQNAPGRSFLKVTGILCIIYGAVLLLSSVSSIFVYKQLTASSLLISIIFVVVAAVVFLAAGILGVANSRKVERAGICMIMGILMIAYVVINFGYGALTSGVAVGSIISTVLMLIVPLLYLWGALKNKEVSDGNVSE